MTVSQPEETAMPGLKGKVALITGAGGMKGVGRATALKLAQNGADLVLTDVLHKPQDIHPSEVPAGWHGLESVAGEVRAFEGRCLTVPCDLGHSEQIAALVKQAIDHFGRIDILVNNARAIIGRDRVPVTELAEDVWNHFIAINTTAVFLLTKIVAREMVRQGKGGRIINIASNASKQASAMGTAYSASKFAVLGITQASALDLAAYGITVNAVCPGPINSNRLSYWEQAKAEEQGIPLEEFRAKIVEAAARATPLGRIAEPEDIANIVAFLASDEASFITGQAYNVNGGLLFH
jgi:3-oxoacyl-[acyl-carrier protein] reductase/meso-butanediol dehydrogenase/(S,S)-butanediol dehydrogenase/diacetyl reductase